jgi:hypothetical protein
LPIEINFQRCDCFDPFSTMGNHFHRLFRPSIVKTKGWSLRALRFYIQSGANSSLPTPAPMQRLP